MPHLAGHCDCGRQIHFPKHARLGHQWQCYRCGKVWTLSTHGKPLYNRASLPPPDSSREEGGSDDSSYASGCGCLIWLAIFLFVMSKCGG